MGNYRGGMRFGMRGGPPMGPRGSSMMPPSRRPAASSMRPPFDLALCEAMFPKVVETDDSALTQALIKRNTLLTPTPVEHTQLMNLVTKITNVVENMIVSPESFTAGTIEEIKQVGSLKKNTMITKRCIGDLAVVFKTLPTLEAVGAFGAFVVAQLKNNEPRETFGCVKKDFGVEIASTNAVVRLLVTTIPMNLKKLDPTLHINPKQAHINMASIRHARYLDEQASHSTIKVLVRILKDIRNRFFHLQPLNVWMIELLAYYAVMNTPNHQPLPVNQAFRRCFQLLACGIFTPGSAGIMDPCEVSGVHVQSYMTYEEQDTVCSVAQTLLRVLCHGGYNVILGIERSASNVSTEMSVWQGVVVSPMDKAYDPALFEEPPVAAKQSLLTMDVSAY